jgi:N-ethylmaleimide reductase
VAGKYDFTRASWVLEKGYGPGRFGCRQFGLSRCLPEALPLAAFPPDTLFGGDQHGYTEYPVWPADRSVNDASIPSARSLAGPKLTV